MMVHQGFNSFLKCSSRFFSEEFKHSSSCITKPNSFYLIFWGGVMSLLIIFLSCFTIHKFFNSDISKSIIFSSLKTSFQSLNIFIGVILGHISPKAFPKDCCYLWCLQMTQVLLLSSRWNSFSSSCSYQSNLLFSVIGRISAHNFEMSSISPRQAYPFAVDNPITPFENML